MVVNGDWGGAVPNIEEQGLYDFKNQPYNRDKH